MKRVISLLLIFGGVSGQAGVKIVRTGGDVLACRRVSEITDSKGTVSLAEGDLEYLSLDIKTNEDFRGLQPQVDDLNGSALERAVQLVERLRWLDPERVDRYLGWLAVWNNEATFEEKNFEDVLDSANFIESISCQSVQAIIQETEDFRVSYRISGPVWRKLNVNHQAFMIVHEIIYRDAHTKGHQNSFYVAYLNSLIASKKIEYITRTQYYAILSEIGF